MIESSSDLKTYLGIKVATIASDGQVRVSISFQAAMAQRSGCSAELRISTGPVVDQTETALASAYCRRWLFRITNTTAGIEREALPHNNAVDIMRLGRRYEVQPIHRGCIEHCEGQKRIRNTATFTKHS